MPRKATAASLAGSLDHSRSTATCSLRGIAYHSTKLTESQPCEMRYDARWGRASFNVDATDRRLFVVTYPQAVDWKGGMGNRRCCRTRHGDPAAAARRRRSQRRQTSSSRRWGAMQDPHERLYLPDDGTRSARCRRSRSAADTVGVNETAGGDSTARRRRGDGGPMLRTSTICCGLLSGITSGNGADGLRPGEDRPCQADPNAETGSCCRHRRR